MTAVVCDCSVSAAWCLQDDTSDAADRIFDQIGTGEIIVPAIWPAEMANVLWAAERHGRISHADAVAALAAVLRLRLRADPSGAASSMALLQVARSSGLSAYDAAYLELALREGLPLATLDRPLAKAARLAGVQLV